jgi:hypothetical protein
MNRSGQNRSLRPSEQDDAANAHHSYLERAAKNAHRKPVCLIHCPATKRPMRASTCRERQELAKTIPAILAGCKNCPRFKGE